MIRGAVLALSALIGLFVTARAEFTQANYLLLLNKAPATSGSSPVYSWDFVAQGAIDAANMTFARSGLATMVNPSGYITYAPNNLLINSNNFSTWSKSNITVTTGISDPFSGTAASTYTAVTNSNYIYQSGQKAFNFINAIWVRRRTGSGTVYMTTPANGNTPITVTGSWSQVSLAGPTVNNPVLSNVLTVSGDEIDVYAATNAAVTYETTPRPQDQVITTAAAYYGPRVNSSGLAIEPSATNILISSNNLTNVAWSASNITTAQTQVGPDNVANSATLLTASAGNGAICQAVTLASSQRSASAYVKRITGVGEIDMSTDGGATWTAITGTVGASWVLSSIPAQTVTNPSTCFRIVTSTDAIAVSYVNNEGGAFPTSRIPTAAAAATRATETLTATSALSTALAAGPWAYSWTSEQTGSTACTTGAAGAFTSPTTAGWMQSIKVYAPGTPGGQVVC